MKPLKIAFVHKGYREVRNFLFRKKNQYLQVFDYNKILSFIIFKTHKKTNYRYLNSFNDFGLTNSRYHILHLFHGVSHVKKAWIVTFSSVMPRHSKKAQKDVKRMADKYCKKMIALCANAERILNFHIRSNFPEYAEEIREKIEVLHPPQELHVTPQLIKKDSQTTIKFCLVGADFFRKGGKEILEVFKKFQLEGVANWELTIVSNLQYGEYATLTTRQNQEMAEKMIKENNRIIHYRSLPNTRVIDLFKQSHIGLVPTWADQQNELKIFKT